MRVTTLVAVLNYLHILLGHKQFGGSKHLEVRPPASRSYAPGIGYSYHFSWKFGKYFLFHIVASILKINVSISNL